MLRYLHCWFCNCTNPRLWPCYTIWKAFLNFLNSNVTIIKNSYLCMFLLVCVIRQMKVVLEFYSYVLPAYLTSWSEAIPLIHLFIYLFWLMHIKDAYTYWHLYSACCWNRGLSARWADWMKFHTTNYMLQYSVMN